MLLEELKELGAQLPKLQPLDELMQLNAEISSNFSAVAH
jgi:hypothetical protein